MNHLVIDELAESPFVITVAGNTAASKSTFILGVAAEVHRTSRLGDLPISAVPRQSQVRALRERIRKLYVDGSRLSANQESDVDEGYVVRLQWPEGKRANLALFDVAGEVITDQQKSAKYGRFLYSSNAIILLLDPDGFPDPHKFMESVGGAELIDPQQVNVLADGIEQVTQRRIYDSEPKPLIVTVAKADKVPELFGLLQRNTAITREDMGRVLRDESIAVRSYLRDHGLEPVVSAAEFRFGARSVGYAAVSALGGELGDRDLGIHLGPVNCWRPVALALFLAGAL